MRGAACLLCPPEDDRGRTLELELLEMFDTVTVSADSKGLSASHLLLIDLDLPGLILSETESVAERRIGYSRHQDMRAPFPVLCRPFPIVELRRLALAEEEAALLATEDGRTVILDGETIHLTEREAALFTILYRAGGAKVSREELQAAVFPDALAPSSELNVYIHYLRKKLERNRRKLIRAHRGGGYSLLAE